MAATAPGVTSYKNLSSSCHVLTGFSHPLSHGRQTRVVASWPFKQNTDAPKPTTIQAKKQPINDGKSERISKPKIDIAQLLERRSHAQPVFGTLPDIHSDCQTWLPPTPKVANPRSIYNAASLAYLGDCIYEEALLNKLLEVDFLSEEERDIIRWGGNKESGKTRTIRRAGVAVYSRASSLETLVGYLYLTNGNRLEALMRKLGF